MWKRHFQRHRTSGLEVGGLENGAHGAAINHIGDLEALVEKAAGLEFLCHRRGGGGRRGIRHRASIVPYPRDVFDPHDLHGDVVVRSSFLREPNEVLARGGRRHAVHAVAQLVLGQAPVQAVRALNDGIVVAQRRPVVLDLNRRVLADAARQHRAQIARHRLFFRDEAHLELHRDVRVIRGQLPNLSLAHEIRAGIPHVPDGDLVAPEERNGERRRHPSRLVAVHPGIVNGQICFVEQSPEQLIGRRCSLSVTEDFQRGGHSEPARYLAVAVTADTVSQQRNTTSDLLLLMVVGLPKEQKVLIVRTKTGMRQFGVRQLHAILMIVSIWRQEKCEPR